MSTPPQDRPRRGASGTSAPSAASIASSGSSVTTIEPRPGAAPGSLGFPRFRPPKLAVDALGRSGRLHHIRLDRALEFLIGDYLS